MIVLKPNKSVNSIPIGQLLKKIWNMPIVKKAVWLAITTVVEKLSEKIISLIGRKKGDKKKKEKKESKSN